MAVPLTKAMAKCLEGLLHRFCMDINDNMEYSQLYPEGTIVDCFYKEVFNFHSCVQ